MRATVLPLLLATAALALSGCMGGDGTGQMNLHVTDAPDDIGDFSFLNVTVTKIVLKAKDDKSTDENKTDAKLTFAPATATFDLTKLTSGNVSTIFKDQVPAGSYTKMTLYVQDAQGTLQDGTSVPVKAPSGRLFVTTDFTVEEGKETDFLFDIQVHKTGNGEYQFKPNATGSGPGKKGSAEATGAAGGDKSGKGK